MPYASNKQAAFMHIHHPEIAAEWSKKGHGYVKGGKNDPNRKKKVRKSREVPGWLKPLAIGTAGGALANQFPSWEQRQRRKARKQGQVKKVLITSTDPNFNHEAAQKAFDLVMKMDDDTAEMFTHIVVSDYFEGTVEKNLSTLQRHLNETIAKQLTDLKQAHVRLVAKGMDSQEAVAYAQAIALLEKQLEPVSKIGASQKYGYVWEETDFNRDPGTGRFRTKVSHNRTLKMDERTFEGLTGKKTPAKTKDGRDLSYEDQVRFQDEYLQVAGFLNAVRESTGGKGNTSVMMHYRDREGNDFSQVHYGSNPPKDDLADPDYRLMGIEAKPTTLTAGGAAFGLATALGGGMNPEQISAINATTGKPGTKFTEAWLQSGGDRNSNEKLYGRLAASGDFLSAVGPPGGKAQMAGKFAQIVGSAGPQAEAVLGPSARKTAYRYRGTEKTPEKAMVRAYSQRVEQGKVYGGEPEEPGGRVREPRRQPKPQAAPGLKQMVEARAQAVGRAPTWDERELGRQAVVDHLRRKMPNKGLYELQLASGNTPPSEGVIINADGQLVTQAVGYGDDHYLPFNLKNLKELKGGEYIRTRSVGGLTSEDIYTALIAGARQVTVTSRSGTYTMTFEPDFRGGRRHNDKARRMTRRYEQLLDAVQSQQVERLEIDPLIRQQIEAEVKEEMSGPGWRRSDIQEAINERITEFKENPYITEQDEQRAEAIINSRAANASEHERARIRAQVYDDLMDQKETRFRLNSQGYKAALDALQEQFPYYISKPRWTPPRDEEQKIDTTLDRGYVEPGRNRPTAAAAGLFGVSGAGKYAGKGGKFSAREANYQGARTAKLKPIEAPEEGETKEKKGTDAHADRRKKAAEAKIEYQVGETAKKIQDHAKANLDDESQAKPDIREALEFSAEDLKDQEKLNRFNRWAMNYLNLPAVREPGLRRAWEQAVGHRDRKKYDREAAGAYPKQPPLFDEDPYQPGADKNKVLREMDKIDRKSRGGVVNPLPYTKQSEPELEAEHRALALMYRQLKDDPHTPLSNDDLNDIPGVDAASPALARGLRSDPEKILDQMEYLQRSRALLTQVSEEERNKRETAPIKETKTNAPSTPAERAKAQEDAKTDAQWALRIAGELKKLKNPDQKEIEAIQTLGMQIENNLDDFRSEADLKAFKETKEKEYETLTRATLRLQNRGPGGTLRE